VIAFKCGALGFIAANNNVYHLSITALEAHISTLVHFKKERKNPCLSWSSTGQTAGAKFTTITKEQDVQMDKI
jgi:hypothetical protein